MFQVIVNCNAEKPAYVKVEGQNIILIPDIRDASKFEENSMALSLVLDKARKNFQEDKLLFCACKVDKRIFGNKPRHVVKEEVILGDSYFYTIDSLG